MSSYIYTYLLVITVYQQMLQHTLFRDDITRWAILNAFISFDLFKQDACITRIPWLLNNREHFSYRHEG